LEKKKSKRIGFKNDVEEVLSHPWFDSVDVNDMMEKNIVPPFIP